MRAIYLSFLILLTLLSCGAGGKRASADSTVSGLDSVSEASAEGAALFNADSAFSYLAKQVAFGPRVPNSVAHHQAGDYLVSELRRHGASVLEQRADLTAFDGTILHARNIFGQFNPNAERRLLLVAHYDCRPWADQDEDPAKRNLPVEGANDGASGVALLLELARIFPLLNLDTGLDILFTDAEDWGTDNNDDSWAMGTRYFVNNPILPGYSPSVVIVADMVGGAGASFPMEFFSMQNAPALTQRIWQAAAAAGHADRFPAVPGGAVTDDHIEFQKAGIPAIDIIEYYPGSGFDPDWHTSHDTLGNIDRETLRAVGETLTHYLVFSD